MLMQFLNLLALFSYIIQQHYWAKINYLFYYLYYCYIFIIYQQENVYFFSFFDNKYTFKTRVFNEQPKNEEHPKEEWNAQLYCYMNGSMDEKICIKFRAKNGTGTARHLKCWLWNSVKVL